MLHEFSPSKQTGLSGRGKPGPKQLRGPLVPRGHSLEATMTTPIPNAMDLHDALNLARQLGLEVRYLDGTGEVVIRDEDQVVRHNARRKVASRALTRLLRRRWRRFCRK